MITINAAARLRADKLTAVGVESRHVAAAIAKFLNLRKVNAKHYAPSFNRLLNSLNDDDNDQAKAESLNVMRQLHEDIKDTEDLIQAIKKGYLYNK